MHLSWFVALKINSPGIGTVNKVHDNRGDGINDPETPNMYTNCTTFIQKHFEV